MGVSPDEIRKPAVAGQFYPASSSRLQQTLDDLFEQAEPAEDESNVIALVAPHAGYPYSGRIAASSFRRVAGRRFDTVFVLSPSHRDVFEGVSVFTGKGYETPLGIVPVDQARAAALIDHDPDCLRETDLGHRLEHGIEVELPFLQRILAPGWRLVPIVMLDRSPDACRRVAEAIQEIARDSAFLVVASSDLYHGYSYEACHATDSKTLESIEHLDPDSFLGGLATQTYQACGGGPIAVAMHVARGCGCERARLIAHTTSGDVSGDREGYVVGYGAVVFYGTHKTAAPDGFNEEERRRLLRLAREAVRRSTGAQDEAESGHPFENTRLAEIHGAFVTLRHRGALRGCIGNIHPKTPLYKTIPNIALAAATQDPRFSPLEKNEMDELTISISILSKMKRLRNIEDIQIGMHGLFIRHKNDSGLLLPQVASDRAWDRITFLEQVCDKAGLPSDAWEAPETELFTFTTEVFGDSPS